MKTINPSEIPSMQLQSILQTSVSPRPIALASTIDKNGNVNLSPFSFFNIVSINPPILAFSPVIKAQENTLKDTLKNILEVPEVVIGNVTYNMAHQISLSSAEFERGIDEFAKAGFTKKNAELIKPPLIEESPVNFECKVLEVKSFGKNGGAGNLVICEIIKIHIQEVFLKEDGIPDQIKFDLISRLGGNWYGRSTSESLFEIPRPVKGIGFDGLPNEIKRSKILTGNNLGMLACIEELPDGSYSADEILHTKAQKLLSENKVAEAWHVLKI
jgi:flavin reductase (DIM6/NTAB) family NADH-FMN oxidoreductase RutF